jgi:hypothetical protein
MQRSKGTAMVARVLTVGMVAGALMLAAPVKANAQQGYRGAEYGHGGDHFRGAAYDRFHGPGRGIEVRPRDRFVPRENWGRGYGDRRVDHGYDRGYGRGYDRGYGYR